MAKKKTAEADGALDAIIGAYDRDPDMLIPMLQDLQAQEGYLPAESLRRLARGLNIPLTRVFGVASFYSSFRLAPKGRHVISLCMGTVCYLKGARDIANAICTHFKVAAGGTTSDRLFTFQPVNCVGACALAPVMVIDGTYHEKMDPAKAVKVIEGLDTGEAKVGA
ncbi:MAG: NAD(P)H-dependent oxidoreductase subunit E [Planctomycetota bacterium]